MRATIGSARIVVIGLALALLPSFAMAQQTVRIGLGAPTLSFLPIWSARALDTFKPLGLTANVVALPGGDPSALAALDAGDIDLAAVGPDSMLRAAAKGQPFEIVYSLMSKVTLQLVVSPALLERTGVKPSDPLQKRLAAAFISGHRVNKITVTPEGHVVYVFNNEAFFVGMAPEGAAGFQFEA